MAPTSKKMRLSIESLGPKGDGVALGLVGPIYVDRTAPGDEISAHLFRDRLGVNRAEMVSLIIPSPVRQFPPCPHFEVCGNCTLQHLTLEYYQSWKKELIKEAFQKVGLRPQKWLKPVFLSGKNRRRLTFTLVKKQGKITLGYYQRRSKNISPIDSCEIALPELFKIRDSLKPFLKYLVHPTQPVDLSFQWVDNKIDMIISGLAIKKNQANNPILNVLKELTEMSNISRVSLRQENKIDVLIQKAPIKKTFGDIIVSLPPAAFLQPTQDGEEALVSAVMKALPPSGTFADLFSGCGTFTGSLLSRGKVEAFESSQSAVKALNQAGKNHPLKAVARDLFKHPLRTKELNHFDAIVFDPPRTGCVEQAHEMAKSRCKTLIGVSCNPATFARDAKILCRGGYQLQSLQLVDQFLWSHHVEVVGVFTKGR